jgi:formylglycine-generating enzyme required for sulfatase activity
MPEKPATTPEPGPDTGAPAVPAQTSPAAGAGAMVKIPGGTFQMGADDIGHAEKPVHSVTVASFEIDKTEVTVAAYGACVTAGKCKETSTGGGCNWGKSDRANNPMNCVNYQKASDYCAWAGKRLPTEEEWEYAARGGSEQRKYPWGNDEPTSQLCWKRNTFTERKGTCDVGSFPAGASKWGVLDMAGNVSEWTSGWYMEGYNQKRAPDGYNSRVLRGGGIGDKAGGVRAERRFAQPEINGDPDTGIRCAR